VIAVDLFEGGLGQPLGQRRAGLGGDETHAALCRRGVEQPSEQARAGRSVTEEDCAPVRVAVRGVGEPSIAEIEIPWGVRDQTAGPVAGGDSYTVVPHGVKNG